MNIELTIIDFTSVNARRIIVINALLPLVGKDTKETLAQTISPILKIPGSAFTILQFLVRFKMACSVLRQAIPYLVFPSSTFSSFKYTTLLSYP